MQELNLDLFNDRIHDHSEELERKFMDAFADFNQEFLWKFEGISLICLKLERAKAIAIVKKIWSQYAFIFYKTLTSGTKRESISVLYALIQMGNLSAVMANDLIQNFNFNLKLKTSWTISRKKCTQMQYPYEEYIKEYDTRSLFILFICTLLRKSEVQARKKFASQAKGIIGQVFSGLEKDTEYIQQVFLETLKKYVIDPDTIQKNIKISILQVRHLEKIAILNKPISYEFLNHVCTRPGYGICYEDKGWYPPENEKVNIYNKILSDFIPGLKVLRIQGHKELLLTILRNCPELVKGYVTKMHLLPIDQFLHQDWEDSIKVFADIVSLPIPKHFGSLMELPPPVAGVIDSIVPLCVTSNITTKGLQHSNGLIKVKIAQFLCLALQKLDTVIKALLARSVDGEGNKWSECADELLGQVQKRIPSWQLIVSFHHSCISDELENHLEIKRFAYKLILFYQKYFSKTIQQSNFNYGKLILTHMHTLPSDIQYLFLEIMGNVSEFKWWMVGDNSASHFKSLLNYFVSCRNRELKDEALSSLVTCLSKSTLFCENSDYLYILLWSLQASSKSHQNSVIFFLDKSICESEKSSARLSTIRTGFDNLIPQLCSERGLDGSYFCLYWLVESFKRIIHLKETNVEHIVIFFSRLILQQLYSIVESADPLLFIGTILNKTLSDFKSSNFQKLLENALNIVKMTSGNRENLVIYNKNNSSGQVKKPVGKSYFLTYVVLKEEDLCKLQYSPHELLRIAMQKDLVLSPEMIHETVSALSLYHPAHISPDNYKLNPSIFHFLPSSYVLEYCIHVSDISPLLSVIDAFLDTRVLRFIFAHGVLCLTRLSKSYDSKRVNLCGSVLISIIERSLELNCAEEIVYSKPFQTLLSNTCHDLIYSKLLEGDVITVCTCRMISKILQLQNHHVNDALISHIWQLKNIFIKNISHSFPTIADLQLFDIFKCVRKTEILMELMDMAYSKLEFKKFCWILENLLMADDTGVVSGRFFSIIVQECTASPSDKSFALLEKILSPKKSDLLVEDPIISLNQCNLFGTNLMILDEDLAAKFIPILATNFSLQIKHTIRYFIRYYPRLWKSFLKSICKEKISFKEVILLLECFIHCCTTSDSSYKYCWKGFIEENIKLALDGFWFHIQESVIYELKESLFGKREYDNGIAFISRACSSLFGLSSSFLEEILIGIPNMSCNNDTPVILLTLLPLLRILGDSPNRKCMALAIILRIFRGYLIYMKDKELTFNIQDFVKEIISLSNDIKISNQVFSDGNDNEIIKYMSNFVMTVLKSYFENYMLVSCIISLWKASYQSKFNLLSGDRLLDLVITHSKFHDLMVSHDMKHFNIQFQLALMIRMIMELSPAEFCKVIYLEKLVPVYSGTVKPSDRLLLSIFAMFETRLGISSLTWIQNDWTNKGNGDILHSLDISRMIQTITDFPVDQNMNDVLDKDYNICCFDENVYYLYDISFLIPFAASLLLDSCNTLDLSLFIKSNLLGIVIMGLSSTSEQTRRASSSVLVKVYEVLNSSDLKERMFLILLLNALKNAIICDTNIPPRIPTIIAYFVAQSLIALMNSESLMYPLINRFILQRPVLDLKDIPMFYERMYSSSEFSRYERIWLLKLLSCGMMNDNDYYILKRRHAIDILFSLYNSSVCDSQMKLIILETLYKSSKKSDITKSIIMRSSILTFFHSLCLKADFVALEEYTLCIPSVLASFGKMCHALNSKSNVYSLFLSSIITTMSFYLRLLIDSFPNIRNRSMGYGALSHIINLYTDLVGKSQHLSIFGTKDIMNVISIVDLCDTSTEEVTCEKVITPSRIHIEKILSREYRGTKDSIRCLVAKWIFSSCTITLDNSYCMAILEWVSSIVVQNEGMYEGFGKWVISCRLGNQNHSFQSIYQNSKWMSFMKNLFIICNSTEKVGMSIYSSLMLLIIRDLDYADPKVLEMVARVPSPRQILLESFKDEDQDIEIIFDQLRKIIWAPSRSFCDN